jgi:NitT/TauT family transport system permease protein
VSSVPAAHPEATLKVGKLPRRRPLLADPETARRLAPLLLGVLVLLAWQGGCMYWQVPRYLVPTPLDVMRTLIHSWPELLHALAMTLRITLYAFASSVVLGVGLAFVMVQSRTVELSLMPYAILLQVTPVVAIAPLIIVWIRDPTIALVVCATLVAIFPVISNTVLGLRSVPPGLRQLFILQRATRWQTLTRLRIPAALPYFFAGLRISSGLSLIGAVVAEFVAGTGGTSAGLAYLILLSGQQLDIPLMFAALVLIAAMGLALYFMVVLAARLSMRHWQDGESL